ncbi:MAG TPA: DUF3574 domain-containing protein [Gemmatimonadales bacterium]|nr:DUF3574 domain-containing protein [Gemmatimonadales bacterium]
MLSAHQMHTRLGFSVSLALLLLACAPAMQSSGLQDVVTERLYFGRNAANTLVVSDSAWAAFLREVVSTQLPGGFTIWPAEGEWRGPGERPSREPSFVLEVVHPPRSVGTDSAIVAIIAEYKRRFGQESVLRVITAGRASY